MAETFGSRSKASEALKEGKVFRAGVRLFPDSEIEEGAPLSSFLFAKEEFVSQGGKKLQRALDFFSESVEGKIFADLGSSTGGFVDVLLKRGAKKVFAVDVGSSLLAPALREDERVEVMDNTNARYLTSSSFSLPLDGVTGDLSFISLRLLLPAISSLLPSGGKAFLLFKPQFECGKGKVGKSGICPRALHRKLLSSFYADAKLFSLAPKGVVNAPLREKKNIEYIVFLEKDGAAIPEYAFLESADCLL